MKNFFLKTLVLAGFAAALCSCSNKPEAYKINRFEDNPYLAEVWWGDDYDSDYATEFLCKKYNGGGSGLCSSWHKGNLHGRNIDWMMRDYATIIIHFPKSEKVKYASVSLVAGVPVANKDLLDKEYIPEELRSWLPATVVDGINECGVAINHNIVPYDGKPYEANGDLVSPMVCRAVLDNCASAAEAVEFLQSKKVTQAAVAIANDYSHFFISDAVSSYVVEWINCEFRATEFKADGEGNYISAAGQPAIMTNYFVAEAEAMGFKTGEFFKNNPSAAGVERAETIMSMLPDATTVEDNFNICKAVWYSQFCNGTRQQWYTENSGNYGFCEETGKAFWFYPTKDDIHWMEDGDVYAAAKALAESGSMQNYYDTFNNGGNVISPDNSYWFTQHSVVYDIAAKKGYVLMQEGMFSDKVVEFGI